MVRASLNSKGRYVIDQQMNDLTLFVYTLMQCPEDDSTHRLALNDYVYYGTWVEGKGRTYYQHYLLGGGGYEMSMGAHIINGVQVGNILTDSYILSIEEREDEGLLRVWPNPVHTTIFLESPVPLTGQIRIHSATGRLVRLSTLNGGTTAQVDVADLPDGMYLLTVGEDKRLRRRIIVQNK